MIALAFAVYSVRDDSAQAGAFGTARREDNVFGIARAMAGE